MHQGEVSSPCRAGGERPRRRCWSTSPTARLPRGSAVASVCNTDSLGEQLQRALPRTRVVKALNTMWCGVMVDPRRLPDKHLVFLCGDDAEAKATVSQLLAGFGWRDDEIVDLGDLTAARGTEMLLPLWLRLYGLRGDGAFNFALVP